MEDDDDGGTTYDWCTLKDSQRLSKRAGEVENRRTSRDPPNYWTVDVNLNTEKNPGHLRRLAVSETIKRPSACVKNLQRVNKWKNILSLLSIKNIVSYLLFVKALIEVILILNRKWWYKYCNSSGKSII